MKRLFLIRLIAVLPLIPLAAEQSEAKTPVKPNIILIMADDLGYAGLRCYGQKLMLTPEIDKMAAEGMRFTDFYSASAACVPSRVAMLLGMHPGQAPIRDNLLPHLPNFEGYMEAIPDVRRPGILGDRGTCSQELFMVEMLDFIRANKDDPFFILAELAGVDAPAHTDGISLVPTLLGQPERQQPREYLYWEYHQGKQQAVRMGPWKGVRIGGAKQPIELYNLDADIGETRNVAANHPEIVKKSRRSWGKPGQIPKSTGSGHCPNTA